MKLPADVQSSWYPALTRSNIVVLTGAGASVPLGMPAMDGFYEHLSNDHRQWASQFLKSHPDAGNDLEFLLGRLAWFERMAEERQRDKLVEGCIPPTPITELASRARELKSVIFRSILRVYGELQPEVRPKAKELYFDLYNELCKEAGTYPEVLPIFTTNYDLTFEALRDADSQFEICNGMSIQGEYKVWSPETYQKESFRFAIFRLHGCSHWVRRKPEGDIVFQAAPDLDDPTYKEPCVLYPVPGKDSRIGEEPFKTAYDHLSGCLRNAKFVIIIGYSGRDEAVQSRLQESLYADPQKKFLLITKNESIPEPFRWLNRPTGSFSPPSGGISVHLSGGIEMNTKAILDAVRGKSPTAP